MQNNDLQGFYKALSVEPSSTAEEIKAAYRRLAKATHPDASGANTAEKFHRISAAYDVLSDPIKRAEYDSSAYQTTTQEAKHHRIDPICCSRCGKITAQPRYVVFFRVYSFLFATVRKPVQGIFCAACAKKEALKSSAITLFTGWWGVPWGPLYSVGSILINGFGGKHEQKSDERMIWYNALAFLSHGNLQLSYALATLSKLAGDKSIASDASELASQLEKAGANTRQSGLKNPWRSSLTTIAIHVTMAFALPGAVTAMIIADSEGPARTYTATTLYSPPPTKANYPSRQTAPAQNVPTCAQAPYNGELLQANLLDATEGHALEIRNGASGNAIIKLREASTNRIVAAFFVRSNQTAQINGIPDGMYKVQYAFGDKLDIACRKFVELDGAGQFPGVQSLQTKQTATQVETQVLSYTLYAVPAGNVRPQTISAQDFERP
ncbi:J domain-containing protein [Rhizobium sp. LEGMi198b]